MKIKVTIDYGDRVESYELSKYYEVHLSRLKTVVDNDVKATPLAALHIVLGLSHKLIYKSLIVEVVE